MEESKRIKPYRSWTEFKNPECKKFFDKCQNDSDLLIFPRDNYLSVYCNGLDFAIIEPNNPEEVAQYIDDDAFRTLKEKVSAGMPKDQERRAQHQIATKHLNLNTDKENDIVICDFEYTIRKEDFDGKAPGIDLVGIDFSNKASPCPVFIEYKRTKAALKKNGSGVEDHYNDMVNICKRPGLKRAIAEGAMASYNILVDMGILKAERISKIDAENAWFAFLFTDLQEKEFYGYLSKIQAQHIQHVQNENLRFPLRVASFGTNEDVLLRTDKFTDITEFLLNKKGQAGRNRYKPIL